jgi:hypothetical protein
MLTTIKTIDIDQLGSITGGVRPGPNGEGCTGPFPRPFPRPNPTPGPLGGGNGGLGGLGGLGGIGGNNGGAE